MRLTVYFDGQFWAALIERENENGLSAGSYIFGSEPKDGEILEFVNKKVLSIIDRQTETIIHETKEVKKNNPKRMKRLAAKELKSNPVSTLSQLAVQKQLEKNKKEKKVILKKEKEEKINHKRELAAEKAKMKHRGK